LAERRDDAVLCRAGRYAHSAVPATLAGRRWLPIGRCCTLVWCCCPQLTDARAIRSQNALRQGVAFGDDLLIPQAPVLIFQATVPASAASASPNTAAA